MSFGMSGERRALYCLNWFKACRRLLDLDEARYPGVSALFYDEMLGTLECDEFYNLDRERHSARTLHNFPDHPNVEGVLRERFERHRDVYKTDFDNAIHAAFVAYYKRLLWGTE